MMEERESAQSGLSALPLFGPLKYRTPGSNSTRSISSATEEKQIWSMASVGPIDLQAAGAIRSAVGHAFGACESIKLLRGPNRATAGKPSRNEK